jgi:hypothetical protein
MSQIEYEYELLSTTRSLRVEIINIVTISPKTTNLIGSSNMSIPEEIKDFDIYHDETELIFFLVLGILSIPANLFLFIFYCKKVRLYKTGALFIQSDQIKGGRQDTNVKTYHLNTRYARIANSFHTYMIEICCFDTLVVVILVINSIFKFLYSYGKSEYESVYDISNFACKFFVYILRISAAMSNYLVFFLALNRCFLIIFKYKPMQMSSHRLCFNTKYLTLFLFCICTIANVFRLEMLNIHNQFSDDEKAAANILPIPLPIECSPTFSLEQKINDNLAIMLLVYNILFSLMPSAFNFIISFFMIYKRSDYKKKLDLLLFYFNQSKLGKKRAKKQDFLNTNPNMNTTACSNDLDEITIINNNNNNNNHNHTSCNQTTNLLKLSNRCNSSGNFGSNIVKEDVVRRDFWFNEFHGEYLKTCTPCIAFSISNAALFLPHSIIDIINQKRTTPELMTAYLYLSYMRYFFYCCKFYYLFLLSYKFRFEFKMYFKKTKEQFEQHEKNEA